MSDKNVVYTYTPVEGYRLTGTLPARDITARDLERMSPDARRELKALADAGEFYAAVNKSAATRTVNQVRKAEVEAAADAAESEG